MKKTLKRFFASLMVVVTVLTAAPLSAITGINFAWLDFNTKASALTYSGARGNMKWTLDTDTGELIISGTGDMGAWYYGQAPWYSHRHDIKSVVITYGITNISNYAFQECDLLTDISIPESVVNIGYYPFLDCSSLTSLKIPISVTSIGSYFVDGCKNLTDIYYAGTESQWDALVGAPNNKLKEVTIHFHTHAYEVYVTIPATHTSTGIMTYTCECGDSYTDIIDTIEGHSYDAIVVEPTCEDKGYITYICECGDSYIDDYVDATGHSHTSEITTPATHASTGVMSYTCKCGDIYTEIIDKIAEHNYISTVTEPTCTEQGYTTYTCECGDSYVDDYVDAIGHSHTAEVTTPATHTSTGVMSYTCSCGDTYTETIAKIAEHSYNALVTSPTCENKGYTTYTCECGDTYVTDYVDATGHTAGDWVVTTPETTTTHGVKIQYCASCETVLETQVIPATGKVSGVAISDISLDYKTSTTITPSITVDSGVKYTVTYSSSDPSVASVDASGKVSTGKTGSATITVTVTDEFGNTVSDTCEVKVNYNWWQWILVIVLFGWIWY